MMLNFFDFTKLFLASLDLPTSDSIMKRFSCILINAIPGDLCNKCFSSTSLPAAEAVSCDGTGVAQAPLNG